MIVVERTGRIVVIVGLGWVLLLLLLRGGAVRAEGRHWWEGEVTIWWIPAMHGVTSVHGTPPVCWI